MRARIAAVAVALLGLTGGLVSALPAAAEPRTPADIPSCLLSGKCGPGLVEGAPAAARRAPSPAAAAAAAPTSVAAAGAPCEDDPSALCGTISVPKNWLRPDGRTIAIAWQFIPHTTPEPAVSTISFIGGGPGDPTIFFSANYAQYLMDGRIGEHDVLAVDQRGRGKSEALDCPELQHATLEWSAALAACARQLGPDIDLYGSSSNARDLEAVRSALGIAKLDLYPLSYGGADAIAYASRFGSHVRSIVLGAAVDVPGTDVPLRFPDNSALVRRAQAGMCADSQTCTAERRHPNVALGLAALALERRPLTGSAVDQFGETRRVTVTASKLTQAATFYSQDVTVPAWIGAAAESYLRGDSAPLLRTIADLEASFGLHDSGDPSEYSAAIGVAQLCADVRKPWRDGLGYEQRIAAARRAVASASPLRLLPFTASEYTAEPDWTPEGTIAVCAHWPDTHAEPVVPPGARLPDIPVLAVTAEYDGNVAIEETERLASRFPHHQSLVVPEETHPAGFFRCAPAKVAQWLVDQGPVEPGCDGGTWSWWIQPSFPRTAAEVSTAIVSRSAGDLSTATDRRVAQAAWKSVMDSWMQGNNRPGGFTNPGLRGGTMSDLYAGDRWLIDFDHYRFVSDVAVTGHFEFVYEASPGMTTDLAIEGPGTSSGTLHLVGDSLFLGREGTLTITGTLGGRPIALTSSSR